MERNEGKEKKNGLSGVNYWPFAIAAFLSVVFMVNAAMLYVAISTDDGLVDEDYYRKGLFYDEGLEGEKSLGWDIGLFVTSGPSTPAVALLRVEVSKAGDAVSGASVSVVLKRPATDRHDHVLRLSPSGGAYTSEFEVPLGGLWDIEVTAGKGGRSMVKTFRIRV